MGNKVVSRAMALACLKALSELRNGGGGLVFGAY